MSLACLIIYKTNFFRQVWENKLVNQFFLNVALVCIGVNCAMLFYFSIYGPLIQGKDIDLEKDTPQLIPVMTVCGLMAFITLMLGLWPVFGVLTPVYLLVLSFGASMSMTFLPGGTCGSLLFWILLFVAGYVSHTMPHDPVW